MHRLSRGKATKSINQSEIDCRNVKYCAFLLCTRKKQNNFSCCRPISILAIVAIVLLLIAAIIAIIVTSVADNFEVILKFLTSHVIYLHHTALPQTKCMHAFAPKTK